MSPSSPPKTRLQEIRMSRGLSCSSLARLADIQIQTLNKIENGHRRLTDTFSSRLAKVLEVPVKELYANIGDPIPGNDELAQPEAIPHVLAESPALFENNARVPLYKMDAFCQNYLKPGLRANCLAHLEAGYKIRGRHDIYALFVEVESMEPWKRPGQIIYVDPSRPPSRGDRVVIIAEKAKEERRIILAEYVNQTATGRIQLIYIKHYYPPCNEALNKNDIIAFHRVLELEDILQTP